MAIGRGSQGLSQCLNRLPVTAYVSLEKQRKCRHEGATLDTGTAWLSLQGQSRRRETQRPRMSRFFRGSALPRELLTCVELGRSPGTHLCAGGG